MSRRSAFLFTLVAASGCVAAQPMPESVPVVIYNNAVVDLMVEVASHRYIGVDPGTSRTVSFQKTQWIEFGMIAHEFQLPIETAGALKGPAIQFQAEVDGKLYLVPADIKMPITPCLGSHLDSH